MIKFFYGEPGQLPKGADYVHPVQIEYEAGEEVPVHEHPMGHWSLVVLGTVEYTVGDKTFDVTAPHRVWVPAERKHGMKAKTKAITLCLMPQI